MISEASIREIITTYTKYGWLLRRVLLTRSSRESMQADVSFNEAPIYDADIDCAWFSRPPQPGGVAWELRYLGATPFALVENADETTPDFEAVLADVQQRLSSAIAERKAA